MKNKLVHGARILLGVVFVVFGANGFFHFLPMPPMSGPPADFLGALIASGYMLPLIKGTEVAAGALLLGNRFVPLALTVLAPVIVNIVAFHAFLAPSGIALPILVLALELFLAWSFRGAFRALLQSRTQPEPTARRENREILAT